MHNVGKRRSALLFALALFGSVSDRPVLAATGSSLQEIDARALDAYVRAGMDAIRVPGLALGVVRGDRVIYLKGYGIAGSDGRPVTVRTPFILGSTSKSFTALAVMQLVEAGRVNLDAPVTTYLPWFRTRNSAESSQITVRHLLNQTSGLRTYEGRQGFCDTDQSQMALENGVRSLFTARLRQPAGQRYEYANENYNILGLIVQAVSGTSYEDYVRSAIFAPLQMNHSAAALSDTAAADLASGHRHWLGWPVAFDAPYPRRMTPAGLLISSAEDMTHYVSAQLNGGTFSQRQLLSPSGIGALHTSGAAVAPGMSYGMGWVIRRDSASTTIWHDGDVSNFHSHLRLLPDQHLGIVVLMNVGGFGHDQAINHLIEGIVATAVGRVPAAPARTGWTARDRCLTLMPVCVAVLWAWRSYRALRTRPHRHAPSLRRLSDVRRFYLPLSVELCAAAILLIVGPSAAQTPLATIALFIPDIFAVVMTTTAVVIASAIGRTCIVLLQARS